MDVLEPAAVDLEPVDDDRRDDAPHSPLEDVDFPSGQARDECVTTVLAVRDYLRENGPASIRQIVTNVMPEYPLSYDVPDLEPGKRYRGSRWRNVVKPGLAALEDVEYRENHNDYRYIGKRET